LRLVTYQKDGNKRLGALVQERVVDLNLAFSEKLAREGEPTPKQVADALLPADMRSFLRRGDRSMELAREVLDDFQINRSKAVYDREDVRILAPVTDPGKIICLSHNYRDFIEETGVPIPPEPRIFAKYQNAICGPEDAVIKPFATNELGYEAEVAFIVGKPARNVLEEAAYGYIAGYTIFNDISASDITTRDKQVVRGKTYDTFAPMGPALVTADEVPDPMDLEFKLCVNGRELQKSNTKMLLYGIPHLVAFLSTVFTLEPGDVVATGTPGGIAKYSKNPTYLMPGDVCKIECEILGILENRIIDESEVRW